MNKRNFFVGMGMGLIVGGCAMGCIMPKKKTIKTMMGKTLHTMGDAADSVSDFLGW